ncbi:unnamed protein product [Lactuca saligna]|uniref:Uncharacterized protein n=1 Tax=Lactuca saligna TaxID=75948 RepID=A0AA35YVZ0_LACSI|nr:unnamed protein product [Lactuca saligna]
MVIDEQGYGIPYLAAAVGGSTTSSSSISFQCSEEAPAIVKSYYGQRIVVCPVVEGDSIFWVMLITVVAAILVLKICTGGDWSSTLKEMNEEDEFNDCNFRKEYTPQQFNDESIISHLQSHAILRSSSSANLRQKRVFPADFSRLPSKRHPPLVLLLSFSTLPSLPPVDLLPEKGRRDAGSKPHATSSCHHWNPPATSLLLPVNHHYHLLLLAAAISHQTETQGSVENLIFAGDSLEMTTRESSEIRNCRKPSIAGFNGFCEHIQQVQ